MTPFVSQRQPANSDAPNWQGFRKALSIGSQEFPNGLLISKMFLAAKDHPAILLGNLLAIQNQIEGFFRRIALLNLPNHFFGIEVGWSISYLVWKFLSASILQNNRLGSDEVSINPPLIWLPQEDPKEGGSAMMYSGLTSKTTGTRADSQKSTTVGENSMANGECHHPKWIPLLNG